MLFSGPLGGGGSAVRGSYALWWECRAGRLAGQSFETEEKGGWQMDLSGLAGERLERVIQHPGRANTRVGCCLNLAKWVRR